MKLKNEKPLSIITIALIVITMYLTSCNKDESFKPTHEQKIETESVDISYQVVNGVLTFKSGAGVHALSQKLSKLSLVELLDFYKSIEFESLISYRNELALKLAEATDENARYEIAIANPNLIDVIPQTDGSSIFTFTELSCTQELLSNKDGVFAIGDMYHMTHNNNVTAVEARSANEAVSKVVNNQQVRLKSVVRPGTPESTKVNNPWTFEKIKYNGTSKYLHVKMQIVKYTVLETDGCKTTGWFEQKLTGAYIKNGVITATTFGVSPYSITVKEADKFTVPNYTVCTGSNVNFPSSSNFHYNTHSTTSTEYLNLSWLFSERFIGKTFYDNILDDLPGNNPYISYVTSWHDYWTEFSDINITIGISEVGNVTINY